MENNEIFIRRSIRTYLPRQVEPEKLERILRAGMQAPSALDGRSWEFIVVQERQGLETLAGMSKYSAMVKEAPAALIICSNQKTAEAAGEKDWWIQGLSACTENILLQIVREGMGGVWLGCYPRQPRVDYIRRHFGLPEEVIPFAVVPFGYSNEPNCWEDRFDPRMIHREAY